MRRLFLSLFIVLLLTACGADKKSQEDDAAEDVTSQEQLAEHGQQIFRDRSFGENPIACADCHADFDEAMAEDDRIRPGHSVLGAHQRVETWNAEFSGDGLRKTAAGASKCAYLYQERGSSIDDALSLEEAAALMAFYAYISPGSDPPKLAWDVVTWPGDTEFSEEDFEAEMEGIEKLRGSAARGKAMFARACAPCHDNGLGPAVRFLKRKAGRVPSAVRSGEDTMPFFSRDKLSDQDIADIQEAIKIGL